jgi:heparan-alpha-glucosaminide N-acetyltransferase
MKQDALLPESTPALGYVAEEGGAPPAKSPSKHKRLMSLDAVRGLTIAVMILVDDAGGSYEEIDHSPWNGITLADIVMPWFLFMVGVSISLAFNKFKGGKEMDGFKKSCVRAVKLFVLGVILQGGGFLDDGSYTYGFNTATIRWCGILQRIGFGYIIVVAIELFIPKTSAAQPTEWSTLSLFRAYSTQWGVVGVLFFLYTVMMLGTKVPSWHMDDTQFMKDLNSSGYQVKSTKIVCDTRGSLSPACNAAGYFDRLILGQAHMYQPGEKWRLPECSACHPGSNYGDPTKGFKGLCIRSDAPNWCVAAFDPEGILASLLAPVTVYIGLHFGHIMVTIKAITKSQQLTPGEMQSMLLKQWGGASAVLLVAGLVLDAGGHGWPHNKQLWSPSYMFTTTGMCGAVLTTVYYLLDIKGYTAPFLPLVWMGMNAILIFIGAASDVLQIFLDIIYWYDSHGDRTNFTTEVKKHMFQSWIHGSSTWDETATADLLYVLAKIGFWFVLAGLMHRNGYYWKI